jgi:pimeloyl-ACP methyl ester carboxylesterase
VLGIRFQEQLADLCRRVLVWSWPNLTESSPWVGQRMSGQIPLFYPELGINQSGLYLLLRLVTMKLSTPVPIRHNRVRLPQGNLFWHEAGQGDAVVFLHGTWYDSSQWLPLVDQLASQYHCIAPDLLGFGESSRLISPYSIALEVESLQALLTMLRIQRVHIVAHSLGAWVGLGLAQRYPDRVKGVMAIEPEGFTAQSLRGRWGLDRWLVATWSPLAWALSGLAPLAKSLGGQRRLPQWQRRQQRLRSNPAACQLLFRRRRSELEAELINAQSWGATLPLVVAEADQSSPAAHHLTAACLQAFPQATHHLLPTAPNPLGLKHGAVEDVIKLLLESCA